jgi:hypothetical protein
MTAFAAHAATGEDAPAAVDTVIRTRAWPAFLAGTKGSDTQRYEWSVAFRRPVRQRRPGPRLVDYGGQWAKTIEEAISYGGLLGSAGGLRDGSNTSEVRTAPREPDAQAQAFWSLTVYSAPDYRVVPTSEVRARLPRAQQPEPPTSIVL